MSPRRTVRSTTVVLGMLLIAPAAGEAQVPASGPRGVPRESSPTASNVHAAPLGRRVTVHASEITLRRALEHLGTAAGVRVSYSSDLLPLDRRVSLGFDDVPLGDALASLLEGVGVEPRVASADHVALVPRASREPADTVAEPIAAFKLEPLRIETDRVAAAMAGRTTATTVITGEQLAARPGTTLAAKLNGAVPGLWLWSGSGSGTQYGSVRGAASFLSNAPSVYVDGIELANPMLLTRLAPETIDRIEFINGPHGAALYGANAMGGVLSVTTRQHVQQDGRPHLRLQSDIGFGASPLAGGTALTQEHGIGVAIGGGGRSARLDVSTASVGELVPTASPRQLAADLAGNITNGRSRVGLTARFLAADIVDDVPPTARARWIMPQPADAFRNQLRQLTAGVTASTQPNARWTHTALIGIDAYALDRLAFPFPLVARNLQTSTAADRATLRLSSRAQIELGDFGHAGLSLAADHSRLRERGALQVVTAPAAAATPAQPDPVTAQPSAGSATDDEPASASANNSDADFARLTANTGLSVHADVTLRDQLVLRGGLRFDQSGGLFGGGRWVTQPVLGASWTDGAGPLEITVRAAYGRAMRWPTLSPLRAARGAQDALAITSYELTPEKQSGIEGGVDLRLGGTLDVQITRFQQTASALMPSLEPVLRETPLSWTPLAQDVGEIENTGWEFQATLRSGALALSGTLALVDSRVAHTTTGYAGELKPGDRMLNVPATTAGLTASWSAAGWSTTLTAARASDWIGYDLSPIAAQNRTTSLLPAGSALRDYWRAYDAITLTSASIQRMLRPGLGITLSGENLLDSRFAPPGDATAVTGRSLSLGVRLNF